MWIVCVGKEYFISYLNLLGFGNLAKLTKSFVAVLFDDISIKFVAFQLYCGRKVRKSKCIVTFQDPMFYCRKSPVTLLSLNILVNLGQEEKEQKLNTKSFCHLKISLQKMSKALSGLPEDEIRQMS